MRGAKIWARGLIAAATALAAARSEGHGFLPVIVNVVDNTLVVSGGLNGIQGYAAQVFADDDDSGSFGPAGQFLLATLPSFRLQTPSGINLFLEVMPRPDFTKPAAPQRWLWYWDETAGSVVDIPNDPTLDIGPNDLDLPNEEPITIKQSAGPAGPVQAAFVDDEVGQHVDLLAYVLDNTPSAALGAYAFFARLTSPGMTSSETFLLAMNHALDSEVFQEAALDINAAASMPGDYDHDGDADGADFLAWQRAVGSSTLLAADWTHDDMVTGADLAVWQSNYGRTVGAVPAAGAVPEPGTIALLAVAALGGPFRRRYSRG